VDTEQVGFVRDWAGNHFLAECDIKRAAALKVQSIYHFGEYGLARGERAEIDQNSRSWVLEHIDGLCSQLNITIFISLTARDGRAISRLVPAEREMALPLGAHGTRYQLLAPADTETRFAEQLAWPRSDRLQVVELRNEGTQ
jgi:hypothetical protein